MLNIIESLKSQKEKPIRKRNIITRLNGLILYVLLVAYGCTSPVLNMPELESDIIKEYKNINVRSNVPYLKNSGIHIKKGEIFSILAKGKIKLFTGLQNFGMDLEQN